MTDFIQLIWYLLTSCLYETKSKKGLPSETKNTQNHEKSLSRIMLHREIQRHPNDFLNIMDQTFTNHNILYILFSRFWLWSSFLTMLNYYQLLLRRKTSVGKRHCLICWGHRNHSVLPVLPVNSYHKSLYFCSICVHPGKATIETV